MDIANSFNDFFINIGKTIESTIPHSKTSFKLFLKNANEKSIFLRPCDQIEVLLIINGLKSSKVSEPNSIPSSILVEFSNFLIEPLTTIINMSLKKGIFPRLNKEAYVCPIFKKNDKLKCENYRLISLLSNISKMFERVMYNRIEELLTPSNILYNMQFGFRKKF